MAAVIRLKRRINEPPLEAVLLACKRSKTDDLANDEDAFTTILQFAGTVKNQEESVFVHIPKSTEEFKPNFFHSVDVTSKLRKETRKNSQLNRFKVVNCFRSINEPEVADNKENESPEESNLKEEKKKFVHVVDVVSTSNDEEMTADANSDTEVDLVKSDSYVYDLYYAGADFDDSLLDTMMSVRPLETDLMYYRNNGSDVSDVEDSDDSNAETNWRNDYPDSDNSVNEADMRLAASMDACQIDDLSSDEGEGEHCYSEELNPLDVQRYGAGYASYKHRVQRELQHSYEHDDDDDDDDYSDQDRVGGHITDSDDEDPTGIFM